ncbi:hypothetical protein RESH_01692 [Rhodopirellula europaea SH398]|uniref:Uncharacterized protein n=1 Tax=Rhodopirellula europaea SH398 TaxID=1263868 RepID=M5S7U0_9BACT|nr:hypothetical protein RESH_01692 [Rhodopirellula europaea SH398]
MRIDFRNLRNGRSHAADDFQPAACSHWSLIAHLVCRTGAT